MSFIVWNFFYQTEFDRDHKMMIESLRIMLKLLRNKRSNAWFLSETLMSWKSDDLMRSIICLETSMWLKDSKLSLCTANVLIALDLKYKKLKKKNEQIAEMKFCAQALTAMMITFMIWFNDCIIWSLNDRSILDLLMQHQYDIKIDVNAKYANQRKTEMKRITAKLKTVYVKKLKVWHKRDVDMRETKLVLNLSQYRKKINDAWSVVMLLWLTWLLKFNQVTEIIKEIEENDWCIVDLDKNFLYHQNLNTLIEESLKIQWLIQFLQRHCKNESE